MHVCRLSDIFSPAEISFLEELGDQGLEEAQATLEAHFKDSPAPYGKESLVDEAEKYLELIEMQKARMRAIKRFLAKLREV